MGTMSLDSDFVGALKAVHPLDLMEQLKSEDRTHFGTHWKIRNEVKPVDLYCYLYARFGPPNGIQNFLRGDHSENLIHWEWTLQSQDRLLLIQGQNFRTEIWFGRGTSIGCTRTIGVDNQVGVCVLRRSNGKDSKST